MMNPQKIKKKIGRVRNIKKITRAMEMVSASKLKRIQSKLFALRPYAAKLEEVMQRLLNSLPPDTTFNPILRAREGESKNKRNLSFFVISSHKGLCGSYNNKILSAANNFAIEQINSTVKIIPLGKKTVDYFKKTKLSIAQNTPMLDKEITPQTGSWLITPFIQQYESGSISEIWIAYTEFVNAMNYKPKIKRLVPILDTNPGKEEDKKESFASGYLFEPKAGIILDKLIPIYMETIFYNILLNALASEHASRMITMRNATDNANEIIDELTLSFNKARQSSITTELLDILGGANALK
jgi:F-type H+-transporting ATPase subunit gamma